MYVRAILGHSLCNSLENVIKKKIDYWIISQTFFFLFLKVRIHLKASSDFWICFSQKTKQDNLSITPTELSRSANCHLKVYFRFIASKWIFDLQSVCHGSFITGIKPIRDFMLLNYHTFTDVLVFGWILSRVRQHGRTDKPKVILCPRWCFWM